MKSSLVTQREYTLKDNVTIVSRTDLHGNIIEANEAFIEASGYSWAELVGQPHNVLRHPDVPKGVFQDFWETLKQGKPWSQIVKNRRKNGDHYWVRANATPIFEKGEVVGYMSVRLPATKAEISAAEEAYRMISSQKLALKHGQPVTLARRFNLINQTSLPLQVGLLTLLMFVLAALAVLQVGVPNAVLLGFLGVAAIAILTLIMRAS